MTKAFALMNNKIDIKTAASDNACETRSMHINFEILYYINNFRAKDCYYCSLFLIVESTAKADFSPREKTQIV